MNSLKECRCCGYWCSVGFFKKSNKNTNWIGHICRICRNAQQLNKYHTILKNDNDAVVAARERTKEWRAKNGNIERNVETARTWRNSTVKGYWANKITSIRSNCRVRALEFDLKRKDLESLYELQRGLCALTGRPLILSRVQSVLDTCSVDRIDNSKGYIPDNVRLITLQSNFAKSTGTDEDLINFCKDIIKHLTPA